MRTYAFTLLTLGATLITLVSLLVLPFRQGRLLARRVYLVVGLLSLTALLVTTLRSAHVLPATAIPPFLSQVLLYRAWIPLGVALAVSAWWLVPRRVDRFFAQTQALGEFTRSPLIPRALRLSIALSFLGVELGKLTHDADMRQFFVASGYPFWMNYLVIVAELIGVAGLFAASLRFYAGLGLTVLMLGGIGTHLRNGDPFSDSLEALQLLILLACLLALWRQGSPERVPRAAA